ncbi:Phytochrome-like protein cph2 [Planctomycetes bacterium Poly30]|uniref:Phytochrome-like protein cph2 n=1 Tax=Saltatorellus ferox TaxID=2528018 RepID=A0A518EPE6_9BACT|nr:Phytochrome-like protein cph2 [Planctomycetes bacterium Poly30]
MSDNELPALPSATATDGLEGMEGLERVDWSRAQDVSGDDGAAEVPGALGLAAWQESVAAHLDEETPSGTVCTIELRVISDSRRLDDVASHAIARAIQEVHSPLGGIALEEGQFTLLLPDGVSWAAVATTIERAVASVGVSSTSVHVGFGLADIGTQGQTAEDAVRLSRIAAIRAYESHLGARVMTLSDEAGLGREEVVARRLAEALDAERGLRLVFQPKIDTGTQGFVGAEALMRFKCADLGEVGPAEFFPIATRTGLLARLEHWVIENAIPAIATMAHQHGLTVPISINVRGADLLADGFVETIGRLLATHDLDPGLLRVEVTEADVLSNLDAAEERLGALREIGVSVALDDFGKEGTTLADLRRLPVDVVKVHRAFTRDMESDETASALIQGVMSLARSVGIETVAVGVESWPQFERLRSFGCGAVQGFLFSPALEASDFIARLPK